MGVAEPTSSGGTISRRFDWSFALLTIVAVAGAWLGRWAFLPGQPADSETIGAIVSTVALIGIGGLLAAVIVAEVRRGRSVRASVPPGYGLSIVGFGVLGLGVLLDVPSTMLFGEPVLLEGTVGVPQLVVTAGAVLVASGPLRNVWHRMRREPLEGATSDPPRLWLDRGPAVLSILCALVLLVQLDWMHPAGEAWWMPAPADPTTASPRNELFVMQADGSGQTRRVSYPSGSIYAPAWSPDGRSIAYQLSPGAAGDSPGDLHVAHADGTEPRLVSPRSDSPSWSPDGARLVFGSDRDDEGNGDIYVANADGTDAHRLTDDPANDFIPVWSPDGLRIAFDTDRSGPTEVWVMNVDGSDQHRLIEGGNSFVGGWSPDGSRIAFASDRDGDFDVYEADADGARITKVTADDASDYDPKWSPDGRQLLFVSFRDGEPELYAMDAGGEETNLTRNPTLDERAGASWSPDGSQIVYSAHGNPPVESVGFIRKDLGIATVLVWSAALAVVGLLIVSVGHPVGAFALLLTVQVALVAAPHQNLRFLPAAIVAGLLVDLVLVGVRGRLPPRGRAVLAATLTPAAFFALYFAALATRGLLDWSPHLWTGSIALAAGIGLFVGWLATMDRDAFDADPGGAYPADAGQA